MTTRREPCRAGAVSAAASAVLLTTLVACEPAQEPPANRALPDPAGAQIATLVLHSAYDRDIAPGETHSYSLDLSPGDFVRIVVDQRGIDVVATLLGPDGEPLASIDRRIGAFGAEPLLALAEQEGTHEFRVKAFEGDAAPASYSVEWVEGRQALAADRIRARASELFSEGEDLRRRREFEAARKNYRLGLESWQEVGEVFWQAETFDRLGYVNAALGDWDEALRCHRESARLFAAAGDAQSESVARNRSANTSYRQGLLQEALDEGLRALELRAEADRSGRARILVNLGQTHQALDEITEAVERYDAARRLLADGTDARAQAQVLHELGVLHRSLGQPELASDYLEEAEDAWTALGNQNGRAASAHQRGRLLLDLGELDQALAALTEALELRRETQHARGQIVALASLGEAHRRRGDRTTALALFEQALEIARSEPSRSAAAEARILVNLGSLSDPEQARSYFDQARTLYRRVEDGTGEAEALLGLARTQRRQGDSSAALRSVEAALDIVESVRPKSFSDDLSYSFFATVQPHFEFYIDLLMELHEGDPSSRYDARALAAAERARARALLDLLHEAGAELRTGADPDLIARERRLERRINAAERWRLGLLGDRRRSEAEREAAAKEVRLLLEDLGRLRSEIRRTSPRYAALTQPRTLGLAEIQKLLNDDSLLLEYWLGAERSFLFAVSPDGLSSLALPGRETLESKVLRAHGLLARSHRPEGRRAVQDALCDLSSILLGPIAAQLGDQRLVIVPDGALQYLPFSALADPRDLDRCPTPEPLLVSNETTYLPSASVLQALRKEAADRPEPEGVVAVIADPVFSADDERLMAARAPRATGGLPAARGAPEGGDPAAPQEPLAFARLVFSRQEAEAILSLVPERSSFRALDFAADKRLLLDGRLAGYRIVHLATHAVLDSERPGLSGIVFSLVDSSGAPRDGLLRAHELYNVRLPADLVVLSACRTALGKEVRGEGLVGLTRGFAYGGAQRLLVGLWNVEDRSTAELMERFYRNLLVDGLRPSAALRAAQISLREKRPAPYYWAALVMQGETDGSIRIHD